MGRRNGLELETLPHYVYLHFSADGTPIYVGRTANPEERPTDTKRRNWIDTESDHVETSEPMPFAAAVWVEAMLIRTLSPKHNTQAPQLRHEERDWRIDRVMQSEGVSMDTARWAVRYMPTNRDDFEALLKRRKSLLAT